MQSLTVDREGPNVPEPSRLSWAAFLDGRADESADAAGSIIDVGEPYFLTAGRTAIARGLKAMGLKPGDKVLVPAYHCIPMVQPLIWVGVEPVFYRIGDDLSVDLEDVKRKLDLRTKALMGVHYFGFPQDCHALRDFCDVYKLFFLEDCAHSFFGSYGGRPIGSFGDLAIASLAKFFPVKEGGCLVSARPETLRLTLRPQTMLDNLSEFSNVLQDSLYYGHLKALYPMGIGLSLLVKLSRKMARQGTERSVNPAYLKSGAKEEIDPSWLDVGATSFSVAVQKRVSRRRIVARRRRNFEHLHLGLSNLPGMRPLLPRLSRDVVPYTFPIWVDDLRRIFPRLEDRAIPMQRFGQFLWDGVDEAVCPSSGALSHHCLQLPCHQELSLEELDWIMEQFSSSVRRR
jgi:dTDP-4-amino-4,6-dideoxygalactose transaminase